MATFANITSHSSTAIRAYLRVTGSAVAHRLLECRPWYDASVTAQRR